MSKALISSISLVRINPETLPQWSCHIKRYAVSRGEVHHPNSRRGKILLNRFCTFPSTALFCSPWKILASSPDLLKENGSRFIQCDQLHMYVCFWYLVKSDLTSLRVYNSLHWTKTRPCLSGQGVLEWSFSACFVLNQVVQLSRLGLVRGLSGLCQL